MNKKGKVIVIGGDHINTLSVIRCLGEKKVDFTILIHNEKKIKSELMVLHSKYAKKLFLVKNNSEDIVKFLLNNIEDNEKQLIIPCSDLAEYTIDNYYKELSTYYYIPGFLNKPGQVCKLMDKYEQKKWADFHQIYMAKTWKITKYYKKDELDNIPIPCILKPCISAFGNKGDIRVCNSINELNKAIKWYFDNKYNEVLIQEFLNKEYELCVVGCILENGKEYKKIIKKIREYPKTGGSASFAKFINDSTINNEVDKIVNSLIEDGYRGLYDIDIMKIKDKFYLNEINFRNSGNSYAFLKSGIKAPYLLYLEKYDKILLSKLNIKSKNIYFMEDISNLNSLEKREITFLTFFRDFFKAKAHSIFLMKDLNIIFYYIKKKGKHDERSN